jgi:RNA polymerase sigma-32 factor
MHREIAVMGRTAGSWLSTFDSGLKRYCAETRRFPLLEAQEELLLARRWREHRDRAAAQRLVGSHLRLVVKIASGYVGYGLPAGEIISEGNVGLMRALERFEPDKGFRFATYAKWWIKASIQEYILRSKSLVKIGTTANQRKLFFKLRQAKGRIGAIEEGDMRPDQVGRIAKELGVTEQDVIDMNRRLGGDLSLNAPLIGDDASTWQDYLVDDAPSQERTLAESQQGDRRRKALAEALAALSERERRILVDRRLVDEPITLNELAGELGVSCERVRQIEMRAFHKVRSAVHQRVKVTDAPRLAA